MSRIALAAALVLWVAVDTARAATMTAHFIDVGHGAATILEFDCGAVLIDSGGEQREGVFEGRERFENYVRQFLTDRPQLEGKFGLIVLSHPVGEDGRVRASGRFVSGAIHE